MRIAAFIGFLIGSGLISFPNGSPEAGLVANGPK